MPSLISRLGKQRVKIMARKTNNELSALPGFFFYPQDATGLEELTYEQRCDIYSNQGCYGIDLTNKGDMECGLANARIPTHRRPGTEIPGYGKVPIDLRGVIQAK